MKEIVNYLNLFTTRELATIMWGLFFLLVIVILKNTRKPLLNILKIFFGKKLRIFWLVILIYTAIVTYCISKIPLWKWIYLKDILIWLITCGFVLCINSTSKESDENYIKKVLKDNLRVIIIVEFFFSTFTFSLLGEIILLPVIALFSILEVYTEKNEKYRQVHNLFSFILSMIGIFLLYKTINIFIIEYKNLNPIDTIISFFIPIIYLILFIPLEYFWELYSKYELLFIRMSFKEGKNKFNYKWNIIKVCKFSVRKVIFFQKEYYSKMYINMTEDELKKIIIEFKEKSKKRRGGVLLMKLRYYIISIIGIILIIILYFNIDTDDIVNVLTLAQTIFAFVTLIIAFIFYDRYNAGSKLNDKTLDVVIDFVEFLTKTPLLLETYRYSNGTLEKQGFSIIQFKSNLKLNKIDNYRLLVNGKAFIKYYAKLIGYLNSPWLPDEIVQAATFLKLNDVNVTEYMENIKENINLLQVCNSDFDNEYLVSLNNISDYKELEKNIAKLMYTINKWVNKQASNINFHV